MMLQINTTDWTDKLRLKPKLSTFKLKD